MHARQVEVISGVAPEQAVGERGVGDGTVGEELHLRLEELVPGLTSFERAEFHAGRTIVFTCWTADDAAGPVIVKYDRTVSVHESFTALEEISDVLADEPHISSPQPRGLNEDPPLLAMSFQHGTPVTALITEAVRTGSSALVDDAATATTLAGRALAVLHNDLPSQEPKAEPRGTVANHLYPIRVEPTTGARRPVRHIYDFAVYNLIYDHAQATLRLIDLPHNTTSTQPDDDLAFFLLTLMNATVGVAAIRRRRFGVEVYRGLTDAFLTEYATRTELDQHDPAFRHRLGALCGLHAINWGYRRVRRSAGLRMTGLNAIAWAMATRPRCPWPWIGPLRTSNRSPR